MWKYPKEYFLSDSFQTDKEQYREMNNELQAISDIGVLHMRRALIQGCVEGTSSTILSTVLERIFVVATAVMAAWAALGIVGDGINFTAIMVMAGMLMAYAVVELLWKGRLEKKKLWLQLYLGLLDRRIAELEH